MSDGTFDPEEETASFIRLMAQHGHETTVVRQKGKKIAITSNAGQQGIMNAAAHLTMKEGGLEEAAKALCAAMAPGKEDVWTHLDQTERGSFRTLAKVVIVAGLKKTSETPPTVVV